MIDPIGIGDRSRVGLYVEVAYIQDLMKVYRSSLGMNSDGLSLLGKAALIVFNSGKNWGSVPRRGCPVEDDMLVCQLFFRYPPIYMDFMGDQGSVIGAVYSREISRRHFRASNFLVLKTCFQSKRFGHGSFNRSFQTCMNCYVT